MKLKLKVTPLQTVIAPIFIFLYLSLFLMNLASAAEVTLVWDANSETNLAGYKLYYESETDLDLYQGTDANEGDSPITIYLEELTDLKAPSFSVTGLDVDQFYYFVLTAFDTSGLESDFSDIVGTVPEEDDNDGSYDLHKSLTGDSESSEGSDSGSGGSCFLTNVIR
jgi:hypothetical protein